MSLLNKFRSIFERTEKPEQLQWDLIQSRSAINRIIDNSNNKPQLIYKHSSACSVSWFAKSSLEKKFNELLEKADLHFVDVIHNRDISNYIEERLSVRHESPQLILLQNGQVSWHGSHGNVRGEIVVEKLLNLQKAS